MKLPAVVAQRASNKGEMRQGGAARCWPATVWLAPRLRCAADNVEGGRAGNFALAMLGSATAADGQHPRPAWREGTPLAECSGWRRRRDCRWLRDKYNHPAFRRVGSG